MDTVMLNSGEIITIGKFRDVTDLVRDSLGHEIAAWLEDYVRKCEEEADNFKSEAKESDDDYDAYKDEQHSLLCDIREELEAVLGMFDQKRLDKKKTRSSIAGVWKMVNNVL